MEERHPVAAGVLIALAVIGILLFLWSLTRVSSLVIILLLSTVLAAGLSPLVDRLRRARLPPGGWSLPTWAALLLVYLGLIVVMLGIAGFVGSVVVAEAIELVSNAPEYFAAAAGWFAGLRGRYAFLPDLAEIADRLRGQAGAISSYAYQATRGLIGFLGNFLVIITVLVVTAYMITGRSAIRESFLRLIPPARRDVYGDTFAEMGRKMGGWLRGQATLALIVGAIIGVVLPIIGIPYPGIIAIVGAAAEMVPMLGPGVAAVPAVILAVFQPTWKLIAVIVFFILLAEFENTYLTPRIMQRQVDLSPLVTILALLAGGSLAGLIGAILAVPLAAAIQVFIRRIVLPAVERSEPADE